MTKGPQCFRQVLPGVDADLQGFIRLKLDCESAKIELRRLLGQGDEGHKMRMSGFTGIEDAGLKREIALPDFLCGGAEKSGGVGFGNQVMPKGQDLFVKGH